MSDSLVSKMTRANHLPQTLSLDHVSPATRLLEKRRQMFEVQEALDAQKEEFARREEAFRRREEGLRKKDLELQDSLIKFNKFLQENESKRNRAEKRAMEKTRQRKQKEQTIVTLKKNLVTMQLESQKLEETVAKHMKFQEYLDSVHSLVPEDYPEITDLLNRYKTLHDTHTDLTQVQQENEAKNEKNRQALHSYTKEQLIKITTHNTDLAALQSKLEAMENETSRLQDSVEVNIQSTAKKTLELGMILMAVENLLQRCTSKLKSLKHDETKVASEDAMKAAHVKQVDDVASKGKKIIDDLDVICAYILDFIDIVDNCPPDKREVGDKTLVKEVVKEGAGVQVSPNMKRSTAGHSKNGSDSHGGSLEESSVSNSVAISQYK